MTPIVAPRRFDGRTAIVTGAGSGIGRSTTQALLAEGARVIATDIDAGRLTDLTSLVDGGDRLVTVAGDIAGADTIERIVTAADGTVHAVASVAGISDAWLPPAEVDDAVWDHVFEVNVTAPMRLTRAVLPLMMAQRAGSIVYVSSEASLRSSVSGAAYTSSKYALNGFSKSVAFYYGPLGIRSNVVAPGGVKTNIVVERRSSYAMQRCAPILEHAVGESVEPQVVAHSICWLLADDSVHINGVVLPCDGGWSTF